MHRPNWVMRAPLIILAALALTAGFLETPPSLGGIHLFKDWMHGVFASTVVLHHEGLSEGMTELIASIAAVTGIGVGFFFAARRRAWVQQWVHRGAGAVLYGISTTGFYVDRTYNTVFVGGFKRLTWILSPEWIDVIINGVMAFIRMCYQVVRASQTGQVRWYVAGLVLGAIILSAGALWL